MFQILSFILAQLAIVIGALVMVVEPLVLLHDNNILVNKFGLTILGVFWGLLVAISIQTQIMDKLNGEQTS